MKRSSLGWILSLAGLAGVLLIRCTEVTIDRDADGNTTAVASGPAAPPVVIDRDGVHEPPTPTPDSITPIYPIRTPPPTETPRRP